MAERSTAVTHELEFVLLETMRTLGHVATSEGEHSEELMAVIDVLSPYVGSFITTRDQVLEVTTKDPKSATSLRIRVDDTYGDEGRVWFPPPAHFAHEDVITRRDGGQPVFRGQLYTYERYGHKFEIHNLINQAVVSVTPDLRVDLVDVDPDAI